jgi:hypothetical protein
VPYDRSLVGSAPLQGRRESFARKLQHPMRDIEPDGAGNEGRRREHDVAGAARQIEHPIRRLQIGEPDQAPLPAAILSV